MSIGKRQTWPRRSSNWGGLRGPAAVYTAAMEMTDDVKEFINIARYAHDDDGTGQGVKAKERMKGRTTATANEDIVLTARTIIL